MAILPRPRLSKSPALRRVMVVEDDAIQGLAIEQALLDHGIEEVEICPSTACSLSKLRARKFDAVVLDVHLADSDEGWEIAELIDAVGGEKTQIIFQTGSPEEIPERIRRLGSVLRKPYDPAELIGALTAPRPRLLGRLRQRQQ
ncbi:MAG: response regulator [Pseudomonadota bacterium]